MILPKAILFDLDDTIVSFSNATIMAWKKSCEDYYHQWNLTKTAG